MACIGSPRFRIVSISDAKLLFVIKRKGAFNYEGTKLHPQGLFNRCRSNRCCGNDVGIVWLLVGKHSERHVVYRYVFYDVCHYGIHDRQRGA